MSVADLKDGLRVSTELPNLTERFFAEHGIDADIRLSYGATEAKVPDIVDVIVELTETGSSLRAAGLKVVGEIMTSYTELFANPASHDDLEKRRAMDQLTTLLRGALEARGRVLVKLNVDEAKLDCVVEKSESVDRMIELGVLRTPAVAFDGKLVLSGHIPKSEEVKQLLGLA